MQTLNLKKLPDESFKIIREVGKLADEKKIPVFLVGGMVRDLILGRKSLDIDIVVEGDAVLFASNLVKRLKEKPHKVLAHKKFGTVAIELLNGVGLDIVTARRESYARPGVLPDVVPGLIADDLFRRDFTMNAVAASLNTPEFGAIYDNFDGYADIQNKIIRVMHYRSFIDDPTRILRAVRYEKRFDFKFETKTLAVLKESMEENAFRSITPVRYFGEFKRILQEEDPRSMLKRLSSMDGLRFFVYDKGVEAGFNEVIHSSLKGDARWMSFFSVLIAALDRESAEELLVSFNMPRIDKARILKRLL